MRNVYYRLEEVMEWDHLLYQLAAYEVNKGMIAIIVDPQQLVNTARKTANTFNYFKRLIQNGECTFEYLYNNVLLRNGPFSQIPGDDSLNTIPDIPKSATPEQHQHRSQIAHLIEAMSASFGLISPPSVAIPAQPILSNDKNGAIDEINTTGENGETKKRSVRPIRKTRKGKRSSQLFRQGV